MTRLAEDGGVARFPKAPPATRARRGLRSQSKKRQSERELRQQVVYATHERSGWRCEARGLVPWVDCRGRLECDERIGRGVYPGAHLDLRVTQSLCHAHHAWKTTHPLEALKLGLRSLSGERQNLPPVEET